MNNPFRKIFDSAVEGVIVTNKKGIITLANPRACQLFGYKREELEGLNIDALVPQKSRGKHKTYRKGFHNDPSPRRMGLGRDLEGRKKDGTVFPIEVSLSELEIEGEQLVSAFIVDITDRKDVEVALKHSEEKLLVYATELEKKVEERTQELATANANLEKINRELQDEVKAREKGEREVFQAYEREKELSDLKSRFVSLASHEFRTPLSTILSSTALIEKYGSQDNEEKKRKHIQRIKNNIQVLTGLLNDFLNLQKMEEGKVKPEPTKFDFGQFAEELVDETQLLLKRGQTIKLQIKDPIGMVVVDRNMLKNICNNLVSNAIKYSPEESPILLKWKKTKGSLTMEVIDKGMGIPKADHTHMFTRFFRANNASGIQGTGLGLYIVKKYIDQLEGSITFKSRLEKGTTFQVQVPINNG